MHDLTQFQERERERERENVSVSDTLIMWVVIIHLLAQLHTIFIDFFLMRPDTPILYKIKKISINFSNTRINLLPI